MISRKKHFLPKFSKKFFDKKPKFLLKMVSVHVFFLFSNFFSILKSQNLKFSAKKSIFLLLAFFQFLVISVKSAFLRVSGHGKTGDMCSEKWRALIGRGRIIRPLIGSEQLRKRDESEILETFFAFLPSPRANTGSWLVDFFHAFLLPPPASKNSEEKWKFEAGKFPTVSSSPQSLQKSPNIDRKVPKKQNFGRKWPISWRQLRRR